MTEQTLHDCAKETAQLYVALDDDMPRIYCFVGLEGLRASEEVVVTISRRHRSAYPVPVPYLEAVEA